MKRALLFPIVAVAIISCLLLKVAPVRGQGTTLQTHQNNLPRLINPASAQFSSLLSQAFARHESLRDRWVQRQLDTAVQNNELSRSHRKLLMSKRRELKAIRNHLESSSLSFEKKQELRLDTQAQLEEWARQHNINLHALVTVS